MPLTYWYHTRMNSLARSQPTHRKRYARKENSKEVTHRKIIRVSFNMNVFLNLSVEFICVLHDRTCILISVRVQVAKAKGQYVELKGISAKCKNTFLLKIFQKKGSFEKE